MKKLPLYPNFSKPDLTEEDVKYLEEARKRGIANIVLATTLAKSGHPGGSLSTLPLLLSVYAGAKVNNKEPLLKDRDRIIVSHGHTSPAVYSVLAEVGFFDAKEMILQFRKAGTRYAGHIEVDVPGVEWGTGNLGQGLSAGTGSALASKLHNLNFKTFVLMGDGEQQKGQISEARRFAVKYKLNNLIAIIDYNKLQIGGDISNIMPQNIAEEYKADGWNVIEIDGKNFKEIYKALYKAYHNKVENPGSPTLILAHTIMGYGISFIENKYEYHGKPLSLDQAKQALKEIGIKEDIDKLIEERKNYKREYTHINFSYPKINTGKPKVYGVDEKLDNRSAYGNALADLGEINNKEKPTILGFTCDLMGSVKMNKFAKICPKEFFECGIQEHHTAVVSGRLSVEDFVVFFSTFGVFGVGETYNQLRLNTMNKTHLKVVCTHIGINVGEDGPTHQSIDYIGLLTSLFNIRVSIPADPNQTDRIIRKIASLSGTDFVGMGRAKAKIITKEDGTPFFDENYEYVPGKADWIRKGENLTLIAIGPMVEKCLEVHNILKEKGYNISVLNMASIVPLDKEAIIEASKKGGIITVEDHHIQTGLGSLVANVLAENRINVPFIKLGLTSYGGSGKPEELYKMQGLDIENILKKSLEILKQ